ncbi:unannotated protein [freshwater metagenome]|uniref:Unannotated protein n=1 Tax=freshwater metagenome TaxID=449393 RepID=A0A6J7K5I7_9ZZZZ
MPWGPTAIAAAAWSWVEKMLHEAQRTSAPRSVRVSINTAVCTVMCSDPVIRAPVSGLVVPNSWRMAMRPGISCSARRISLRPNSASERSATLKSGVLAVIGGLRSDARDPGGARRTARGLVGSSAAHAGVGTAGQSPLCHHPVVVGDPAPRSMSGSR